MWTVRLPLVWCSLKCDISVTIWSGSDLLQARPVFRKTVGAPNIWIPRNPPPVCLHPTRTVVIIDILLRTRAAMHTTIAAAADWQFEASLSEANCKRVREYWSNRSTYMINRQFFVFFCEGPLFVGPLFGRTCWTCLNPPLDGGFFCETTEQWRRVLVLADLYR